MASGHRILKHSAVYTFGSFLEQSLGMILLPIYLQTLSETDMGVIATCRVVTDFTALLLSMGMGIGAARLYFDYREDPAALKDFWGTVFCFLAVISGLFGTVLVLWGEPLLAPFTEGVEFHPYIRLAIITGAVAPVYLAYLRILQIRHFSGTFVLINSSKFIISALVIIFLVLVWKWGSLGPISGRAIAGVLYTGIALVLVWKEINICIRWKYLRRAIGYSAPVLPSMLSTQISNAADRVILMSVHGAAATGLYYTGYTFGYVLSVIVVAVNASFVPIFNDAMKSGDETKFGELRRFSLYLIYGYCVVALGLSFFGQEVVQVIGKPVFHPCYVVIPYIAVFFVLKGIYSQMVSVLQYHRETLKYCVVISVVGMVLNVGLNLLLIPRMGIIGAGQSAMISFLGATVLTGIISHRFTRVRWDYYKYAGLTLVTAVPAIGVTLVDWPSWWVSIPSKVALFFATNLLLNWVAWGNPLFILFRGRTELNFVLDRIRKRRKTDTPPSLEEPPPPVD